jgi:hypothetical protein
MVGPVPIFFKKGQKTHERQFSWPRLKPVVSWKLKIACDGNSASVQLKVVLICWLVYSDR